ncbi:hypothetical protein HK097_000366 [Rhizophlyctis rosea]|uniref:Pleckstrin homology domain-containing protein n=1 Tax=Rhizophlyctis rosea TaxID=64517 RepID=A0AAD5S826_9FUNG|nr:hypothetical protein HK097_000366 [Rhizophlyctis rosea]
MSVRSTHSQTEGGERPLPPARSDSMFFSTREALPTPTATPSKAQERVVLRLHSSNGDDMELVLYVNTAKVKIPRKKAMSDVQEEEQDDEGDERMKIPKTVLADAVVGASVMIKRRASQLGDLLGLAALNLVAHREAVDVDGEERRRSGSVGPVDEASEAIRGSVAVLRSSLTPQVPELRVKDLQSAPEIEVPSSPTASVHVALLDTQYPTDLDLPKLDPHSSSSVTRPSVSSHPDTSESEDSGSEEEGTPNGTTPLGKLFTRKCGGGKAREMENKEGVDRFRGEEVESEYTSDGEESLRKREEIESLTYTMIGSYVSCPFLLDILEGLFQKYNRRDKKPQLRYFWVNPYTRALNWAKRPPSQGKKKLQTKTAFIDSIEWDDPADYPNLNPNRNYPPSFEHAIVVTTPYRKLRIVPTNWYDHRQWIMGLTLLLQRSHSRRPLHEQFMLVDEGRGAGGDDVANGGEGRESGEPAEGGGLVTTPRVIPRMRSQTLGATFGGSEKKSTLPRPKIQIPGREEGGLALLASKALDRSSGTTSSSGHGGTLNRSESPLPGGGSRVTMSGASHSRNAPPTTPTTPTVSRLPRMTSFAEWARRGTVGAGSRRMEVDVPVRPHSVAGNYDDEGLGSVGNSSNGNGSGRDSLPRDAGSIFRTPLKKMRSMGVMRGMGTVKVAKEGGMMELVTEGEESASGGGGGREAAAEVVRPITPGLGTGIPVREGQRPEKAARKRRETVGGARDGGRTTIHDFLSK